MKTVILKAILLLFLIAHSPILRAQFSNFINSSINGKTVNFTEFLSALNEADEKTPQDGKVYQFVLKDITVRFNPEVDKLGMDKRFFEGGEVIVIHESIRMTNIDFDPEFWLLMNKIIFLNHVWLTTTKGLKAIFKNCEFKRSIYFSTNELDFMDFIGCRFEGGFRFTTGVIKDHLKFDSCRFDIKGDYTDEVIRANIGQETRTFSIDNKIENLDVAILNSEFIIAKELRENPRFFISFVNSNFSNVKILNNRIDTSIDFQNALIGNNFQFENNTVNGKVLLYGMNINPLGTRFQWNSIKGNKLALFEPDKKKFYSGSDLKEVPLERFNNIFSSYSIIYSAFKAQGNRFDANSCYIEWKNIETVYLKKLHESNNDILVYFTYLMNIFLAEFCDYGTNPLKSIYISIYVLIFFAILYFFLPNSFSYKELNFYDNLLVCVRYMQNSESLLESLKTDLKNYEVNKKFDLYQSEIKNSKLPLYFFLISLPDYIYIYGRKSSFAFLYHGLSRVYKFEKSKWALMRVFAKVLFFMYILSIVLHNVILRVLDSIALSVNLFTTLGFGNTELKGLPMYLTVIEGFVGWFLLSFFSLSLISQLIN